MPFKLQPPSIHGLWQDYRNYCDNHADMKLYRGKLVLAPRKLIYTIEGFCLFACITQRDLEKYERDKNYRRLIKQMRHESLCRKLDALINGEGCTRGLLFDLKNNHGMDGRRINPNEDLWITMKLHDGPGGTKISGPNGETEYPKEDEEDGLWPEPSQPFSTGGEGNGEGRSKEPSSPPFSTAPCGREGKSEEREEDWREGPRQWHSEDCVVVGPMVSSTSFEPPETQIPTMDNMALGKVAAQPAGGPSAVAGAFEANERIEGYAETQPPAETGETRPESIYEWVGKPRRMLWR